jgi:protein-S-isoprenylcysteine O-methyltransferase Ste14
MADTEAHSDPQPSRVAPGVIFANLAVCVFLSVLLFMLARQSEWTLGWIYLGLLAASVVANVVCLSIWNPILLARRMVFHAGTKVWDHVLMVVFLVVFVNVVVVAVRDLNARDVDPPPGIGWLIGLTIFLPGWVLITWAMIVNPFFEKTVRIQMDHGHHVIDRGPYAYIRHPGYAGFSAVFLSTPLLLASAPTFLLMLISVAVLVIRTALEDRTLQAELPGYRDYADRVRFRLVPGIW